MNSESLAIFFSIPSTFGIITAETEDANTIKAKTRQKIFLFPAKADRLLSLSIQVTVKEKRCSEN